MTESEPITRLLNDWQNGDADALTTLITTVYNELRQMAHGAMRWEREGHLYTPTVLVHEAFLKLREQGWDTAFRDRHHFFRILARVMRHILVDHARHVQAQKRGAGRARMTLSGVDNIGASRAGDLIVAEDPGNLELVLIAPDCGVSPLVRLHGQPTSELAGPAFDPLGRRLYFSSQRGGFSGITYEVEGPFRRIAL